MRLSHLHRLDLAALGMLFVVGATRPAASGWSRTAGGPGTGEGIHAVRETAAGDLIVLASTDSFGTTTGDAWLLRLDAQGHVTSGVVAGNALPGGVDGAVVLDDGGAVVGHRNVRDIFIRHDASISRLAADGTVAWTTDITADPGRFFVNDIVVLADGTFVGVGQAAMTDAGPHVGWAIGLDAAGGVLWQQYHGGVVDTGISFDAAIATSDGGFAVTGWMASGATGEDLLVAKLGPTGGLSWAVTLGGSGSDRGASLAEMAGGGLVVAGSTDSFTASGHAGWIVRLTATGALDGDLVLGGDEWSDLQAIAQVPGGRLVALGRVSEPGFPTNDLWALGIDPLSGAVEWQRAFEGASGDFANEILPLAGGDLLLAGVWGWGFAEEDLWLLRTDELGLIDGCPLVRDTAVGTAPSGARARTQFLPPYPPFGAESPGSVVSGVASVTEVTQCESPACPPLACGDVTATPSPACEGDAVSLLVDVLGGTAPYDVTWDVDGDGLPDQAGNPLVVTLPAGRTTVTAFVVDSCTPAQSCRAALDVDVLSSAPPGDVSDVVAGAPPLLVLESGGRIRFEEIAGATGYNVHAGTIGTWYAPNAASGSACFVATSPAAPGLLEAVPVLAPNTWLIVTASTACAEGGAGRDSFGTERMSVGTWTSCGGGP